MDPLSIEPIPEFTTVTVKEELLDIKYELPNEYEVVQEPCDPYLQETTASDGLSTTTFNAW